MKYYLDADLSPIIAEILRKKRIDAISSHEEDTASLSDEQHLIRAAESGRCLVSRNRDDFMSLTVRFFHELRQHFGVLIVPFSYPPDRFSSIATSLAAYAAQAHDLPAYTFAFLPPPPVSTRQKRKKSR